MDDIRRHGTFVTERRSRRRARHISTSGPGTAPFIYFRIADGAMVGTKRQFTNVIDRENTHKNTQTYIQNNYDIV